MPDPSAHFFFFFNDTATTEIYTLSLHDALPISGLRLAARAPTPARSGARVPFSPILWQTSQRSEEHTSELQSRLHLVCRLLLEKKKKEIRESLGTPGLHTDVTRKYR